MPHAATAPVRSGAALHSCGSAAAAVQWMQVQLVVKLVISFVLLHAGICVRCAGLCYKLCAGVMDKSGKSPAEVGSSCQPLGCPSTLP